MAKPLGNGVPIGAALVNKRVADALKVGDHGTTFGGNPLACKVGLIAFDRLNDPALLSHVNEVSNYIVSELHKFSHPTISEIRGMGLILGIQFDSKLMEASRVCEEALKRNMLVITAGINTIRIVPSLVLTMDQAHQAVDILKASIIAASANKVEDTSKLAALR
ncbi:acetylornithine aminotransferase [Entomophthora muscae]|nr:acetylornithine aminotransferase [Entomophthora muscae]